MHLPPFNAKRSLGLAPRLFEPQLLEPWRRGVPHLACAVVALFALHARAQTLPWEHQPYRIRAVVAIDVPGGVADRFNAELPTYLKRRAIAAIGPVWSLDVELTAGAARHRVFAEVAAPLPPPAGPPTGPPAGKGQGEGAPDEPPSDLPWADIDKLVLIAVVWNSDGYSLAAREYDTFVQRWGMPLRRDARQVEALPEQVFAILAQTVAPVARFELAPDDEKHVILKPRGAALMRPGAAEPWTKPGDVFLPILRRTSRGGQLVENGIQSVQWTFVEVVDKNASGPPPTPEATKRIAPGPFGETVLAQIHSGTRRPFGIRRQGRVEQVAIALRCDLENSTLRIRSRVSQETPLAGYEVFAQPDPQEPDSLVRLGATDRDGLLVVPPAKERVRTLVVKHGDRLLARLPVVPGAEATIDVPLPDDDARLAAETQLAALREDLIDVVARRNILMARVRQKIKSKEFDAAEKLLLEVNQLPGRAQFNTEITNARRRTRSADPQIQRRIDQLFEGTQAALTQYLDTRPINEVSNELRAAQQKKGG